MGRFGGADSIERLLSTGSRSLSRDRCDNGIPYISIMTEESLSQHQDFIPSLVTDQYPANEQ